MKKNNKAAIKALFTILMILGLSFTLFISCRESSEQTQGNSTIITEDEDESIKDTVEQYRPLVDSLNSNL